MAQLKAKKVSGNGTAKEVAALLEARYSLLSIVSHEEQRVEDTLLILAKQLDMGVQCWSCTRGFITAEEDDDGNLVLDNDEGDECNDPMEALSRIAKHGGNCLFVLRDFHPYMQEPSVRRWLRDLAIKLRTETDELGNARMKSVVLLSAVLDLPDELQKEAVVVDWPLPTRSEIDDIVGGLMDELLRSDDGKETKLKPKDLLSRFFPEGRERIVEASLGLTKTEIQNVLAKSLITVNTFDVKTILGEKKQIVRKGGLLDLLDVKETAESVGGLEVFKEDMRILRKAFADSAREKGVDVPKGVMCVGPPGTGKTLLGKVLSSIWRFPLLKTDFGALKGQYVGESERNLRIALKMSEAIAPDISLWDEFEKAFQGAQSTVDSVTPGMLGTTLTWMNDKTSPVFIFATVNNIRVLPAPLWRKGRFDEIYFVDLPNVRERADIIRVHLKQRLQKPDAFDLPMLASQSQNMSGAELEACVQRAVRVAYFHDRDMKESDLVQAISETTPQAQSAQKEIEFLRDWAKVNARHANRQEDAPKSRSRVGGIAKAVAAAASANEPEPEGEPDPNVN